MKFYAVSEMILINCLKLLCLQEATHVTYYRCCNLLNDRNVSVEEALFLFFSGCPV